MEQPPQRPGGEQSPVNSYGTDDPIRQTEIEAARIAASQERRRNRARLEELVAQGADPDEAEAIIEYEHATEDRHTTPGDTSPETPVTAENGERRRYQPWVYVADTSSQEQGLQHGQWFDAARTPDELRADIVALLARSPLPYAAEWQVQASTGFAGLDLHGFVDTVLISELGRGVATHGAAYATWVSIVGTQDHEHLARFTDFYVGSYESLEAWGRSLGEDFQWNAQLDEAVDPMLRPHLRIDYAAVAHTARDSWDVLFGHDGQLHVFLR
jgi:antirestriction protein